MATSTNRKRKAAAAADPQPTPALKLELVDIASLSSDPANARKHGAKNLETIKGSLRRFGQQKPIVVDANNVVRAGNGTLEGAKALGWTQIQIVRSELAGSEMTAFAIADNRSAELAEWDAEVLSAQVSGLQDEGFDLAALGYDDKDLAKLTGNDQPAASEGEGQGAAAEQWLIMVTCRDEAHQVELLGQLSEEGVECKAMNA